jgi:hypothetical protein
MRYASFSWSGSLNASIPIQSSGLLRTSTSQESVGYIVNWSVPMYIPYKILFLYTLREFLYTVEEEKKRVQSIYAV